MLGFNILDLGGHTFRCVLGESYYFDFSVTQLELFGYDSFFENLKSSAGKELYNIITNKKKGEVVSVRYLRSEDEVWVLVRNGIYGELYVKKLGV